MLIAAAAVYGGVSYTALKKEQLNELEALCHMLRLMQDELETRALRSFSIASRQLRSASSWLLTSYLPRNEPSVHKSRAASSECFTLSVTLSSHIL